MKFFSSAQIKEWDNYTILYEPVLSVDLMEGAAGKCFEWLIANLDKKIFKIFCGKGNNGGDGLAIARMLVKNNFDVSIYILESGNPGSKNFEINLERLKPLTKNIFFIHLENDIPAIDQNEIIVDASFGIGLNKSPEGISKLLIEFINQSAAKIISIDMPSGLFADKSSLQNARIKANNTLTFQQHKLASMMAENEKYFGEIKILDIGLHKDFIKNENVSFELVDAELIKTFFKPRDQFAHKGNFGHACLLAGSYGMMGAAILAARACMRSGVGKLTCCIPKIGYEIMQISVPEAMAKICGENSIELADDLEKFDAIGIGPGIGPYSSNEILLKKIFNDYRKSVVLDADALNTISTNKNLLKDIPEGCILTPHPKEFEKLFGKSDNDFERVNLALQKSVEHKIYIVLKGHHTLIATPDKKGYFNSTGNAGMATAGSGDVLTGIITGLLAQGYSSLHTCLLGVYLHGLSGDIAAKNISMEAMIAGDIINYLGEAFKQINQQHEEK